MPKVDIVIVNWNSGNLLKACLESLSNADISSISEIIIVDNGSHDGSADLDFPTLPLSIIRANQNLGFGKACNVGAARGVADYVLFLNPDTEVFENTVSGALSHFDMPDMQNVAVIGIKMTDRLGRTQIQCARFPEWTTFVGESLGLPHINSKRFKSTVLSEFDHNTTADVDHVIGAFYLVRRDVFTDVAGFDETFFVYFEDLDLSKRISKKGWRIRYLSEPSVYHQQGGTSDQIRARRLTYVLEGRFIYARKHFSLFGRIAVQLSILFVEPFTRTALAILRRSPQDVISVWHGYSLFLKSLLARSHSKNWQ